MDNEDVIVTCYYDDGGLVTMSDDQFDKLCAKLEGKLQNHEEIDIPGFSEDRITHINRVTLVRDGVIIGDYNPQMIMRKNMDNLQSELDEIAKDVKFFGLYREGQLTVVDPDRKVVEFVIGDNKEDRYYEIKPVHYAEWKFFMLGFEKYAGREMFERNLCRLKDLLNNNEVEKYS